MRLKTRFKKRRNAKGKNLYNQVIKDNVTGKNIKNVIHRNINHLRLKHMINVLGLNEKLSTVKYEPSEKTLKRKQERNRGVVVWDSRRKGTYIAAIHGTL